MSITSSIRVASCSQVDVAGFAALSAGLVAPKRPPVFELAGMPVAGVVLLVVLEAPMPPVEIVAPPNKLLPGAPPEEVLLVPPVPKPKIPPPVVAGLTGGNPNMDPELTQALVFKTESVRLLRTSCGSRICAGGISKQITLSRSLSGSTCVRACIPEQPASSRRP